MTRQRQDELQQETDPKKAVHDLFQAFSKKKEPVAPPEAPQPSRNAYSEVGQTTPMSRAEQESFGWTPPPGPHPTPDYKGDEKYSPPWKADPGLVPQQKRKSANDILSTWANNLLAQENANKSLEDNPIFVAHPSAEPNVIGENVSNLFMIPRNDLQFIGFQGESLYSLYRKYRGWDKTREAWKEGEKEWKRKEAARWKSPTEAGRARGLTGRRGKMKPGGVLHDPSYIDKRGNLTFAGRSAAGVLPAPQGFEFEPGFIDFLSDRDPRVKGMYEFIKKEVGPDAIGVNSERDRLAGGGREPTWNNARLAWRQYLEEPSKQMYQKWYEDHPTQALLTGVGDLLAFFTIAGGFKKVGQELAEGALKSSMKKAMDAAPRLTPQVLAASNVGAASLAQQQLHKLIERRDEISLREAFAAAAATPLASFAGTKLRNFGFGQSLKENKNWMNKIGVILGTDWVATPGSFAAFGLGAHAADEGMNIILGKEGGDELAQDLTWKQHFFKLMIDSAAAGLFHKYVPDPFKVPGVRELAKSNPARYGDAYEKAMELQGRVSDPDVSIERVSIGDLIETPAGPRRVVQKGNFNVQVEGPKGPETVSGLKIKVIEKAPDRSEMEQAAVDLINNRQIDTIGQARDLLLDKDQHGDARIAAEVDPVLNEMFGDPLKGARVEDIQASRSEVAEFVTNVLQRAEAGRAQEAPAKPAVEPPKAEEPAGEKGAKPREPWQMTREEYKSPDPKPSDYPGRVLVFHATEAGNIESIRSQGLDVGRSKPGQPRSVMGHSTPGEYKGSGQVVFAVKANDPALERLSERGTHPVYGKNHTIVLHRSVRPDEIVSVHGSWSFPKASGLRPGEGARSREMRTGELGDTNQIHRWYVEEAIAEGKPVPARVLAEYPDLAPKGLAAKPTAKPTPITTRDLETLKGLRDNPEGTPILKSSGPRLRERGFIDEQGKLTKAGRDHLRDPNSAADAIRDVEGGYLDTSGLKKIVDTTWAAAKTLAKGSARVAGKIPQRIAESAEGQVRRRQLAVQTLKHAEFYYEGWPGRKAREILGLRAEDIRRDIESGKLKVESIEQSDWRSMRIKLSDGRTVETSHPDAYGRHSMIARSLGAKRPVDVSERWSNVAFIDDVVGRRIPSMADQTVETLIGPQNWYRGLRRAWTEYDANPVLRGLTDAARKEYGHRLDASHAALYELNKLLEAKFPKEDAESLRMRDEVAEVVYFKYRERGRIPKGLFTPSELRDVAKIMKTVRDNFYFLGRTWLDAGMVTEESIQKHLGSKGQTTYVPGVYAKQAAKNAVGTMFRDIVGARSLLEPWAVARVAGNFKKQRYEFWEQVRRGMITDFRSAIDSLGHQLRAGEQMHLFQEIAADPNMFRSSEKDLPEHDQGILKERNKAKKEYDKIFKKMIQKGIIQLGETTPQLKMAQTKAQSSLTRAKERYEEAYSAGAEEAVLKKLLAGVKRAETNWLKTLRGPIPSEGESGHRKLQAYIDNIDTRSFERNPSTITEANKKLSYARAELARLEPELDWLDLSAPNVGPRDQKLLGPMARKIVEVDKETGEETVRFKGGWVRKELALAIMEPMRRTLWMESLGALHALAKKQKTARNLGTHVVNYISNRSLADWAGVNTFSVNYQALESAALEVVRHYQQTGRVEFNEKSSQILFGARRGAKDARGFDHDALLESARRFIESGIVSNSAYQIDTKMASSKDLRGAERRAERAAESGSVADQALARAEKIALTQDIAVTQNLPLVRKLEARYGIADPSQGLAWMWSLTSGKASKFGEAMPESMALRKVRDALDFSLTPLSLTGGGRTVLGKLNPARLASFVRIFYKLPKGVIQGLAAPTQTINLLMKMTPKARQKKLGVIFEALGSVAMKASALIVPFQIAQQLAADRWEQNNEGFRRMVDLLENEEFEGDRDGARKKAMEIAMFRQGFGSEARGWFTMPHYWSDEITFTDVGKHWAPAQAYIWAHDTVVGFNRAIHGRVPMSEAIQSTLQKHVMWSNAGYMYRGEGFFDQDQTFMEGVTNTLGTFILPGIYERAFQNIKGKPTQEPHQRMLNMLGVRERTTEGLGLSKAFEDMRLKSGELEKLDITVTTMPKDLEAALDAARRGGTPLTPAQKNQINAIRRANALRSYQQKLERHRRDKRNQ